MTQRTTTSSVPSTIDVPGRMHPVLALLAFLPMMMIILISMAFMVEQSPPIALMVLLGFVLLCCAMLSWTSLQTMIGGKLEFAPEGLKVSRLLSEQVYPWHEIDACKVTTATGTFGDDALVEANERVGLGLFLRNSTRERDHDLDPDVVICAADKIDVQAMMRIATKVQAALKRAQSPGARAPAPPVATTGMRRAPAQQRPAKRVARKAPPADPVAQFRQRAAGNRGKA